MFRRSNIENWLVHHWYAQHQPPWYLRLLEPLYRAAYKRAQNKQQAGSNPYQSRLPLIVVGNITAGGTGKTPLVIRLCQLAVELDLRPGIVTTGYGREGRDTCVVQPQSATRECGDEPVLLAIRTGVPVVVAANRLDALKKLNEMELDILISDDGLQHADLDPDMEFCVIDGERGFGNGHLLPAGPLREPAERLAQVDYVFSNGEWAGKPENITVNVMNLQADRVRSLDDVQQCSIAEFRQKHAGVAVHAFAAIGNPQRFFRMLESLGINADSHGFSDHYSFTQEDFASIPADSVIMMTEKDAVKCRALGLDNAWYVPVDTCLPEEFELEFKNRLIKLIKDSQ